jgi:hypothetical protein
MSRSKTLLDLFQQVQKIHPDAVWAGFRGSTDDFYIYFKNVPPMEMGEF